MLWIFARRRIPASLKIDVLRRDDLRRHGNEIKSQKALASKRLFEAARATPAREKKGNFCGRKRKQRLEQAESESKRKFQFPERPERKPCAAPPSGAAQKRQAGRRGRDAGGERRAAQAAREGADRRTGGGQAAGGRQAAPPAHAAQTGGPADSRADNRRR